MTDAIAPSLELVREWINDFFGCSVSGEFKVEAAIATRAAQWGADQELEACCVWVNSVDDDDCFGANLRAARRPKPPSLKEQAFEELDKVDMLWDTTEFSQETLNSLDIIRRALEQLPDPS